MQPTRRFEHALMLCELVRKCLEHRGSDPKAHARALEHGLSTQRLEGCLAADAAAGRGIEVARESTFVEHDPVGQLRGNHVLPIFTRGRGLAIGNGLDILGSRDDAFGEQKTHREVHIGSRRAHGDGEIDLTPLAVDKTQANLERLLHRHDVRGGLDHAVAHASNVYSMGGFHRCPHWGERCL